MDRSEVAWRISNFFSSQLDLVRIPLKLYSCLSAADIPCTGDFQPGFRCTPNPVLAFAGLRTKLSGAWKNELCRQADLLMDDKLSFFDLEEQFLGDPIDWHRDHASGKRGPIKPSVLTDYRDFETFGDCKLVWEPNRHHQLVVLARAYRVTGRTDYARDAVRMMVDWIDANPVGYGMNWKSPLELGIRLINWVWTLDLIRDARVIREEDWARILRTIYLMTWDIQRKYSRGSSANNHLIGEAAGVFIATSYFSTFPNATQWRKTSKAILEQEILAQTYSDGCTREHAFGYQLFVIQFLTLSLVSTRSFGDTFTHDFSERLHQMYRFIADISHDTGQHPNMGDADDGYVLNLGDLPNGARELISVGAELFEDDSLRLSETSETVYWLFGNSEPTEATGSEARSSTAYPVSGYFILRNGQQKPLPHMSIVFDCADLGYGNIAAHGHADCLSFTLSVNGHPFLVDSGTYDYFSFPQWRQYFRSTRAHNTVTVDGECQSESLGPFMWGKRAIATLNEWSDSSTSAIVAGEHNGYSRLSDPIVHKRRLVLDKIGGELKIQDKICALESHRICRHFHLAPNCKITQVSDRAVTISRSGIDLLITVDSGALQIDYASHGKKSGWISSGYHSKDASHVLTVTDQIDGATELVATISVID